MILAVDQRIQVKALLIELCGASREWPQASELAHQLRHLLDRELPPTRCLILWCDGLTRDSDMWTINLTSEEMIVLGRVHGQELPDDHEDMEILIAARERNGRRIDTQVVGLWHFARVTVL